MEVLAQERPVETAEPEVILVRHGLLVTLPDVILFDPLQQFRVGMDGDVPFSEIAKDLKNLLNYEGEQVAAPIDVSARRLVTSSVDETILAALTSGTPEYDPCLLLAHVYEYLKHAEQGPYDIEGNEIPPTYVFYVIPRKPDLGRWVVRATWYGDGWALGASPATCEHAWDADDTVYIVAPDS